MLDKNKEDLDTLVKELTRVDGLNNLKIILEKLIDIIVRIDTKDERYEELEKRVEVLEGTVIRFENSKEVRYDHNLCRPIDPLVVIDGFKTLSTVVNTPDFKTLYVRFSKPMTGYIVIK